MRKFALAVFAVGSAMAFAGPSAAQDKVGVEVSDTFIAKYEACIAAKVPASVQEQMKDGITQMRSMWKIMAADVNMKEKVPAMCQQASDTVKQQSAALGCVW